METRNKLFSKIIFEEKSPGFDRLIMLCDGIFAIAMTLLVLDIKLPEGLTSTTFGDAWNSLLVKSIFYVITFVIVANYWKEHRHLMMSVKRQDERFTELTFLFLAIVVFFPVSFNVVVSYGNNSQVVIFYTLILAGCGLSIFFLWAYASWHHRLIDANISRHEILSKMIGILIGPLYYCLSLLLLLIPHIESYFVFISWILLPTVIRIVRYVINWRAKRHELVTPTQQKSELSGS